MGCFFAIRFYHRPENAIRKERPSMQAQCVRSSHISRPSQMRSATRVIEQRRLERMPSTHSTRYGSRRLRRSRARATWGGMGRYGTAKCMAFQVYRGRILRCTCADAKALHPQPPPRSPQESLVNFTMDALHRFPGDMSALGSPPLSSRAQRLRPFICEQELFRPRRGERAHGSNPSRSARFCCNCSMEHCAGFLSGRHRSKRVP